MLNINFPEYLCPSADSGLIKFLNIEPALAAKLKIVIKSVQVLHLKCSLLNKYLHRSINKHYYWHHMYNLEKAFIHSVVNEVVKNNQKANSVADALIP